MQSRRRAYLVTLIFLLLATAGIGYLLSSQHRIRLIAGSFITVTNDSSLNWLGPDLTRSPKRFAPVLLLSPVHGGIDSAIRLITEFEVRYPTPLTNPLPAIDDPDTSLVLLQHSRPLHCYNVDIAMCSMLAGHGIYSRMWDLKGSREVGGNGHNILEVYDSGSARWIAVDPFYQCYFTLRHDPTLLSFTKLRAQLFRDSTQIECHFMVPPPYPHMEEFVVMLMKSLSPFSALHANNDYRWRYDHRYAGLMPLASIFDRQELRVARAIRTVMLGDEDARYLIVDRWSPKYPIALYKSCFSFCIGLLGLSVVMLVLLRFRKRTEKRAQVRAEVNKLESAFSDLS